MLDSPIIIIHDNSMKGKPTISQQLRRRRRALGLSLSGLARRADTSAATLSRYENGWSRFEVYTLRKLAMALGCDLRIELRPTARPRQALSRDEAVRRLARLFWDHELSTADLDVHEVWVAERVLEYGNLDDIHALRAALGEKRFLRTASMANRVSSRTRSLWQKILEKEGIQCTKKYSRNAAWDY